MLPGLIEGHMHVSNLGENHLKLDCYFKSKEDILEMIQKVDEGLAILNEVDSPMRGT